jgi:DNA-binding FrmR family transcriptional regulator
LKSKRITADEAAAKAYTLLKKAEKLISAQVGVTEEQLTLMHAELDNVVKALQGGVTCKEILPKLKAVKERFKRRIASVTVTEQLAAKEKIQEEVAAPSVPIGSLSVVVASNLSNHLNYLPQRRQVA